MTRICIFVAVLNRVSETFIQAHIERLPGVAGAMHKQGLLPAIDGLPALPQNVLPRILRKVSRLLTGRKWEYEIHAGYLAAFERFRPDVILAEYGPAGVEILSVCKEAKVPLVVHFHGFDASVTEVLEAHRDSYRELFQNAAAVVAVSRAMQRKLISIGCPKEKVFYNPYGIDCERFSGADPSRSSPHFVAVGRFVEKKAPHLTLLAFARLIQDVPEAKLRMIGDGPYLEMCRDLAIGLGIEDSVTFLGAQPHAVVQQEMATARAFVQHSVTARTGDSEGTPVAVLEAGAMGLPVIATRHAGIPDVVIEGKTGLLVAERDVAAMAKHMYVLATDAHLAGELGAHAAKHIRKYYTMNQSLSRLGRLLDAVAAGRELGFVQRELEEDFPPLSGATQRPRYSKGLG